MSGIMIFIFLSFFRLILAFLHCAYSGVQCFYLLRSLIRRKLRESLVEVQTPDTQVIVSNYVKKLKKCPSHFVVLVGKDGITYKDFSNLVIWCLAAEIKFVSFYDYSGSLKNNQSMYYKYLITKAMVNPSSLSFSLEKKSPKNGISNKIHLSFLSIEDGKQLIVQLTKNISKKVSANELEISDINEQLINKELFKFNGLPEPDVAVVSGAICSSFGLLPWHIKVTEFMQVKTLKGIQVSDFTSILEKYSSCNQRFGK